MKTGEPSRRLRGLPWPLQPERQEGGIAAGQDQQDAGQRPGALDIDPANARMRVWRAQHMGARQSARGHVIDVASGAADQIGVFLARDRLANSEFAHWAPTSHCGRPTMDADQVRA